jgi:signal transduction histidine kinase
MISDVARLTENINRILNLARIESKSYANEFVDTNLITAMKSFMSNNKHLFQNGNFRIHPPEAELPSLRVNLPLFDMMLMNLLTNAVKYNDSPQPNVDVGFEIHPRKLIIRFADNGIGIEKKELRKIFRKFYQVGRSEDMSAKGSGLGLYLVQSIARIHKWKVEAQSQGIGKGATFSLILPVNAK